jgi:uracil-DNA glycosylase
MPDRGGLATLRSAAADCLGCDLYWDATQTGFGAGPDKARMLMVGEQPVTRRTQRANRPSDQPGNCWTIYSTKPASN